MLSSSTRIIMGNPSEPVLVDLSSDEDDPEDQSSYTFPVPLVRRAVAEPPNRYNSIKHYHDSH